MNGTARQLEKATAFKFSVVVKKPYLQPCCSGQKFLFFSSIGWNQKCLQAKETTFPKASNQVGTLTEVINNCKNDLCSRAISDAEDLCNEWGVTLSRQIKENVSSPRKILDKIVIEISDHFS